MRRPGLPAAMIALLALPASADEILVGPVLHASATGTMTITWTTAEERIGELEYGIGGLDRTWTEEEPATRHVATLTGLEPGRRYGFRVAGGPGGTFRAGPQADGPFRFTVAGDTRTQPFYHRTVLDRALSVKPDIHVNTGDLVEDGGSEMLWDTFFALEYDLLRHVAFLPVIGNHDRSTVELYDDIWRLPGTRENPCFFSLRYGNTLFLVLDDSEIGGLDGAQDEWVLEVLEAARQDPSVRHIFPCWHVPPLSSGDHGNSTNTRMLGWLHEAFQEAGVRVVFNGHDHDYERSLYDGIHYVVAGGGGAPRHGVMSSPPINPQEHSVAFAHEYSFVQVDVDGDRLVLSAFNLDGDRIDRVEIE